MPRKPPTPEKAREYQERYKSKRKAEDAEGYAAYRASLNRDWISRNRERYNRAKSEYRFSLKIEAIDHYSNGTRSCKICGFCADLDALCLDHIADDGAAHRKELGMSGRGTTSGTTIYERLKALGWLPGLQVLCFNCNTIKEIRRKRGGITAEEYLSIVSGGPRRWKS